MPTYVISTIGTSLLTNNASIETGGVLRRTANLRNLEDPDRGIVDERIARVSEELSKKNDQYARSASAELNGLLSMGAVESTYSHYLLCTDTYQGKATGELVRNWLVGHGCRDVMVQAIDSLSTADQSEFAEGIDKLLQWCDSTLSDLRRQKFRIVFNLVGGFKSFQAYAQVMGMFYADEICYLFEGKDSPLIRIPRLPLMWDTAPLNQYAAELTRMDQTNEQVQLGDVPDMPEAYLTILEGEAGLSEWGKLAWKQNRKEILKADLLAHPELEYTDNFKKDYENRQSLIERVALQEALAKTASLWKAGGLTKLKLDGGLQYENYVRSKIGHFRINDNFRVSCEVQGNLLRLRHYGPHDYVNDKP